MTEVVDYYGDSNENAQRYVAAAFVRKMLGLCGRVRKGGPIVAIAKRRD